jgi:DNA invertase Pin-like site-specific DNA recombinase
MTAIEECAAYHARGFYARKVFDSRTQWGERGGTLHVHSIDRLARNLGDLLTLVNELTEQGVAIKFHKENLVFNGEANPMQELQLSMLGAVAQFERALIRERQREGIAIAKAAGRYKGRKAAMSDEDIDQARSMKAVGLTMVAVAKQIGVARSTLYKSLAE